MTLATLAFDTASTATTVALARGGEVVERRHDPGTGERPGHQTRLLALLREAMAEAEVGWDGVERLVVGTGPGGFTGLRIGVATARALAQARDVPAVGVSTLEALALGAEGEAETVLAALDARRGEAFAAAWRGREPVLEAAVLGPDALAEAAAAAAPTATPPLMAVGDGAVRFRETLEAIGVDVPHDESPLHRVSARHHLRLAAERAVTAPADVLPDYLRLPDAEIARRSR